MTGTEDGVMGVGGLRRGMMGVVNEEGCDGRGGCGKQLGMGWVDGYCLGNGHFRAERYG